MCGFFSFATGMSARQIADLFQLSNPPKNERDIQSLKFYPKTLIPTISKNSPNKLVMRYWSLVPHWWKDDPRMMKFSTFNARIEDVATKPTFRSAWSHRQRCLIPADSFYEFQTLQVAGKSKPTKIPYRVSVQDQAIIGLGGLYETWTDGHRKVESCTIITRPAVESLKTIHFRQPIILPKKQWEEWLNPMTPMYPEELLKNSSNQLSLTKLDTNYFRQLS